MMTQLAHDGLELWYGTADAPAPDPTTPRSQRVSLTVGVRPAHPANAVSVRYRLDGRGVETISAPLVANDFPQRTQYFRATFPTFWSGGTVEYLPVLVCGGRRVPDPATVGSFPSSFRVGPAPPAHPHPSPSPRSGAEFPPLLEHLVHVRVELAPEPEFLGQTPLGFVVNWAPLSGTLDGPAFSAAVIPSGEHETTIRPDGVGELAVRVTVRTMDGALISLRYRGTVDYGEDWSTQLSRGRWPDRLPVRSQIRLLTAAPQYQWLNRVPCLGVGEVRPRERLYHYDMYAVR
jgi:hypothetical protein